MQANHLKAKVDEVRTSLYGQLFVLTCIRSQVDPNDESSIEILTKAIEEIRAVANYALHDLQPQLAQ